MFTTHCVYPYPISVIPGLLALETEISRNSCELYAAKFQVKSKALNRLKSHLIWRDHFLNLYRCICRNRIRRFTARRGLVRLDSQA
jgi:hypothetical protein